VRLRAPADHAPSADVLERLRDQKQAVISYLRARRSAKPEVSQAVPAGSTLRAPRFDGYGHALKAIPKCWCCKMPWELERVQEWKGETTAWLKPSCGCLDAPQALACCGLCVKHCNCHDQRHSGCCTSLGR
jgi:hypothetical protein